MENYWALSLDSEVKVYNLKVDWSKKGFGYILYAGNPEEGVLVELNSEGSLEDTNSFLGELRAI